jgi:RNA polymerase sigma factor (sigma-70 family)
VKRWLGDKHLSTVNTMAGEPAEASSLTGRVSVACLGGEGSVPVRDLFRDHWLELVRLALVMVGDLATAEDVVQDAFERLHRGANGLRQPSSGLAYARSCVLNGCRQVHRRAAIARKYGPRLAGHPQSGGLDAMSAVDDTGEVMAALQLLPRRQREVIVLRYYADLDAAEIAATLGITPGAVRATISRALAALGQAVGRTDR